jgi:hypothetical protein
MPGLLRTARLPLLVILGAFTPPPGSAQQPPPKYLRDRGEAVSSSMFGTWLRRGELLLFPFVASTRDHDREYHKATDRSPQLGLMFSSRPR